MMPLTRNSSPIVLATNWKKWTHAYQKGGSFYWHNSQKTILDELKKMSDNHCAFCDDLLFPSTGELGQIEHLKPKEKYKAFAFAWLNLYPICSRCNLKKGQRYSAHLLKPDAKGYAFSKWLWLNPIDGKLKPIKLNPNWKRAEKTIELYGLNSEDKIVRRLEERDNRINNINQSKAIPFRFL